MASRPVLVLGAALCLAAGAGLGVWGSHRVAAVQEQAVHDGAGLSQAAVPVPLAPSGPSAASPAEASPGPVSVGFAQDMSLHHEQALVMADLASIQAGDAVRVLAAGIRTAQQRELGLMQGWLMLWGAPPSSPDDDMVWMRQAYQQSRQRNVAYEQYLERCQKGRAMPGMASPEEMEHLATLKGRPFDRQFLSLMIRHHQEALIMARFVAEQGESDVVRGVAASMQADQYTELARMVRLLTQAGAQAQR
jgi:uncharacterized protein (DUF305 family)